MSGFLHELHRYRTQHHQHREDYLSTCMAELMRRDQEGCRSILSTLSLSPPEPLWPRQIHTQITLAGTRDRPDVRVWVGRGADRWEALIECKVDEPASLEQVQRYQAGGRRVAFLAPAAKIRALDHRWEGIPAASWEEIHQALSALNARLDSASVPAFRADFLDLLEGFHLAPPPVLNPIAVRAAMAAFARVGDLGSLVQRAVQQMLPEGITYTTFDDATGVEAGWYAEALGAGWESDEAPLLGVPLEGLYLEASIGEAVGDDVLTWTLSIYPTAPARLTWAEQATQMGFELTNEYWALILHDAGDTDRSFHDQLVTAVQGARACLAELGIATAQGGVELGTDVGMEPLYAVSAAIRSTDRLSSALQEWEDELRRLLKMRLQAAGLLTRETTRRPRTLFVRRGDSEHRVGLWHKLDSESSLIGIWLGVDRPVAEVLVDRLEHPRLQSRVGRRGKFDLLLHADRNDLGQLVEDACAVLVSVLEETA